MHLVQMTSNNGTAAMKIVTSGVNKNMNVVVFWDVTSCSLVEIYSGLGTTCCLPLQCRCWREQVFPKYQQICVRIHGVTFRNSTTCIVTFVRMSNFAR